MGVAGSLLVFTGFWHAFEWAMHGRNKDTARLIPFGIIYAILGWLLVTGQFAPFAAWIALAVTAIGIVAAFSTRNTADIPKWVMWAFIVVDVVILASLILAFFT